MAETWRKCNACKKDIAFLAVHWVCSVSTCNRNRTGFVFCSVSCWDSHLGEARHRDAWANEARAPSKEVWQREMAAQEAAPAAPASKPGSAPVARPPVAPVTRPAQTPVTRPNTQTAQGFAPRLSEQRSGPPVEARKPDPIPPRPSAEREDDEGDAAPSPRRPPATPDSVQVAAPRMAAEVDEDAPFALRRPPPPEPVRPASPASDLTSRNVAPPPPASSTPARRVVGEANPSTAAALEGVQLSDTFEKDILIVVSKMKKYIRDRSGFNCSDAVAEMLSDHVRNLCDDSIRAAARDERKTVLDRDVPRPRR
jgi:hypothetical protein